MTKRKMAAVFMALLLGVTAAGPICAPAADDAGFSETSARPEDDLQVILETASVTENRNVVTGHIENVGDMSWKHVVLTAVFLDAGGNELAREVSMAASGGEIAAGASAAFEISTPLNTDIATARVEVMSADPAEEPVQGADQTEEPVQGAAQTGDLSIEAGEWTAIPNSAGGVSRRLPITVSPSGSYYLLTDYPGSIPVRDGQGKVTSYVSSGDSMDFSESVSGAFAMQDIEESGLEIHFSEPEIERHDYESLEETSFSITSEVTEAGGASFLVFYDITSEDGLETQGSLCVVDGHGEISAYISDKPYLSEYHFQAAATNAVRIFEEEGADLSRFSLGDFEYDIYESDYSQSVSGTVPVSGDPGDTGFLAYEMIKDGGEPEIRRTVISEGKGKINTYDTGTTEETGDRYSFRLLKFFPAPLHVSFTCSCSEDVPIQAFSIPEVISECDYYFGLEAAADGTWLTLDTNPSDWEDWDHDYSNIQTVNLMLGLPSSLFDEMMATGPSDGLKTRSYDNVTVSWTNDPVKGLAVRYDAA